MIKYYGNSKLMKNSCLAFILIVFAVVFRLLPHPPNLAPMGSIALVSGLFLPKKYSLLVPLTAVLVTDFVLGFYSTVGWVYGSYFIITMLAFTFRHSASLYKRLGLPLASSLIFFIITNFGVWWSTSLYAKNISGLIECYILAVPFFRNTIIGDLLYSTILFTAFDLWKNRNLILSTVQSLIKRTSVVLKF